jgi:hypothetical protein
MVLVKGSPESEAGVLPSRELVEAMTEYNEDLVKNGVMLAGEGLQPTSKGARIRFDGSKKTVLDGPFAEAKEIVAGFWLIQARDLAEAIEWLKRSPFQDGEVEIRQVFEDDDFGDVLTPELREKEARLRAEASKNAPA